MFYTWYFKDILTTAKRNQFLHAVSLVDAVICHWVVWSTGSGEGGRLGFAPCLFHLLLVTLDFAYQENQVTLITLSSICN